VNSIALAVVLWAVGYLGYCYFRPWRVCLKCHGSPRNYSKNRKTFNESCRWCGTSGKKRRWGSLLIGRGYGLR